jgi:hypothetical protein
MTVLEDQSPRFPSLSESGRYRCCGQRKKRFIFTQAPGVAIAQRAEGLLGINKNILAPQLSEVTTKTTDPVVKPINGNRRVLIQKDHAANAV